LPPPGGVRQKKQDNRARKESKSWNQDDKTSQWGKGHKKKIPGKEESITEKKREKKQPSGLVRKNDLGSNSY